MTSTSRSTRRRDAWLLGIAVLVAAVLVGVLVAGTRGNDQLESAQSVGSNAAPETGPLGDLARRTPSDPMALGAIDAPVVMVAFSDFRCPFCAQFSLETEPQLVDRYVEDGTLRIEWRDLPIFGKQSFDAARAGRAAAAQEKFWEFTHAVYADAPATGHADLTIAALESFAQQRHTSTNPLRRRRRRSWCDTWTDSLGGPPTQPGQAGRTPQRRPVGGDGTPGPWWASSR